MKTKAVESEEEVPEETAPTQAEPASEPEPASESVVEETPSDKVQD